MKLLTPTYWKDYELIDSGNFQKLERFGQYILIRPEPQAIWDKSLSEEEWKKRSNAFFKFEKGQSDVNEKGEWILKKGMPEQWFVEYSYKEMILKMRLGLTSFRHVGIFPEQAENWNYIYDSIKSFSTKEPQVLNLFAYTGGASLAAKAAGADVYHVDSVKQVINWSKENMDASRLLNIRWVIEDALKFVKREVKRGKKYNGIILDPPKYGRGPEGERWLLEEGLNEMIKLCKQLAHENDFFIILNLYSMGFSSLVATNLIESVFGVQNEKEYGELYLNDHFNKRLPLGVFLRFKK